MRKFRTLTTLLGFAGVLSALTLVAPAVHAQSQHNDPPKTGAKSGTKAATPISPADSAACAQVIGYAFQNPDVMQKSQQLQANNNIKAIGTLPDSIRKHIAKAIKNGEGDTLKALARQLLDTKTAPTLDPFIDLIVAFPDSIRDAVGTLVRSGRSMTCS